MKKVFIGIILGIIFSHLFIAIKNDIRLRGQPKGGGMIENVLKLKKF